MTRRRARTARDGRRAAVRTVPVAASAFALLAMPVAAALTALRRSRA